MKEILLFAVALMFLCACTAGNKSNTVSPQAAPEQTSGPEAFVPKFNTDTAYTYIQKQVYFGPRVPGTEAHRRCAEWIAATLQENGADSIIVQSAKVRAFNGDELPITNIMGMYNPEATKRVLLAAHYDTRPWGDAESDPELRAKPIPGANDGASGVGALLEIARQIGMRRPDIGVDILLVDAEDYGDSGGFGMNEETWCLGTQHWAKNMPYTRENMPVYGIVLDMVAGTNARFHREYLSNRTAPQIVDKVWGEARRGGFDRTFINEVGGSIIDDHIFIDRAGIPCIDIVECNNAITRSFPPTWHTRHDDMAAIDITPLRAVGQTVLSVLYSERP